MGSVLAPLRYVAPQIQPLHTCAVDPPHGGSRFNGVLVEHRLAIYDVRGLERILGL